MTAILNMHTHAKFKGIYQMVVRKAASDIVVSDTGPFDNLILNQGLDQIGSPPVFNTSFGTPYINTHCGVGTGTTAPVSTDVALEAPLGMYPTNPGSNVEGGTLSYVAAVGGNPAYYRCIWTYSFPAGTATGNLSEVGVGGTLSSSTTPILFSRALIVDSGGIPTTITVLADEVLTVTYELRMYLDQTDNSYSFFINTTSYSGTVRRANLATPPLIYYSCQIGSFSSMYIQCFNGSIGTVFSSPSGSGDTSNAFNEISQGTYTNGTYYRNFTRNIPITEANINISAILTRSPHGFWQFSVSPPIPKTSSLSLQLNWRQSWSLYP